LGYWLSVRHGFETFLWTRLGLVLLGIGIHLWVARIAVGFPVLRTALHVFKVSMVGIPLVMIGSSLDGLGDVSLHRTLLVTLVLAAGAVGYLWFIERGSLIPEIIGIVTRGSRVAASGRR